MSESKQSVHHDAESGVSTPTATKEEQCNTGLNSLSKEEQRRVLRKIDLRVSVILGFLNCICVMDRSNYALAAVAGMDKELELNTNHRYSIAALIFFVPYIIFEFPSTILARHVGARRLLMSISIMWGIVMICTGFITNWTQLAGLRVVLGFFESAFNPVVVFLLSSWYTRFEVQKRFALFLVITASITSFSGVLAAGLMQMHGLAGISGWRWTYIMEGILTVLLGAVIGSLVVDFPDRARLRSKFLTHNQFEWVIRRLRDDRDDVDTEAFSWKKFCRPARNVHIWLFGAILCGCTTVGYCVGLFLPLILHRDMGFSRINSLYLTAPPYLFASIPAFLAGWLGDKYRMRGPIMIFNSIVTIVGLVLLGWVQNNAVRYFSLFVINSGILANIPTVAAYQANNVRGQWVRAFGSATFVVGGGLGGIFGGLLFGDVNASNFKKGIGACIAVKFAVIILVVGLTIFFRRQNQLAKKGKKLIYEHTGFYYCL